MGSWEGFTEDWLKKHEQNQNKNNSNRHRLASDELQKQQKNVHHKQKVADADEGHHPKVKRSIFCNFRHHDNRGRDDDGSQATILDCLVRAGIFVDDNNKYIQRQSIGATKEKQSGCDIVIIEITD